MHGWGAMVAQSLSGSQPVSPATFSTTHQLLQASLTGLPPKLIGNILGLLAQTDFSLPRAALVASVPGPCDGFHVGEPLLPTKPSTASLGGLHKAVSPSATTTWQTSCRPRYAQVRPPRAAVPPEDPGAAALCGPRPVLVSGGIKHSPNGTAGA